MSNRYQVLITPLITEDTYSSTTTDVSEYVDLQDVSAIKSGVDSGDFDFGVFTYDFITVKFQNVDGKFNDQTDVRSMFKFKRDRAKVQVKFFNPDDTSNISFNGIINEEGSRLDVNTQEVKLKVLSNDSVIRNTKVTAGQVTDGMTFLTALNTLLNVPRITNLITFDSSQINPQVNLTIDDGSWFDNRPMKTALDLLLLASNSILIIDKATNTMVVKGRDDHGTIINSFFGPGNFDGKENVFDVKDYNSGFHRTFNSIRINDSVKFNSILVDEFGSREKEISIPFITDTTKEETIASALLAEFEAPKIEMEILVKQKDAQSIEFLDLISVDYPPRINPYGDDDLPIYGVAKYGTGVYPEEHGPLMISPNLAFKVIGIREIPNSFMVFLKLRQRGTGLSDGDLANAGSFYGIAKYGTNVYAAGDDPTNTNIYGGAVYGTDEY